MFDIMAGNYDNALANLNASLAQVSNTIGAANLDRINRDFAKEQAAEQRAWNEEMWAKTNAWNYQMWQETNAYNSPASQVQRLRDAGLNPMFYGLDGSSANAMEVSQPLGYQRADYQSTINPIAAGLDGALKAAQVANIEAATQKTKSETTAISAKLPFEVDVLRSQIRNSNASADAQETINKYLDSQQSAEIRVKNSTAAEADAMVQKAFAEIEKMDYEKTTMMIGWLETQEKILNLQKQRDLTDKQIDELGSLISLNNANAKKIGLDVSNYDDVTVIGTASHSMHMGPFSVQEGEPITLAMLKAAREHADSLKKNEKNNKRSQEGSVSTADGSPYTGPIYD